MFGQGSVKGVITAADDDSPLASATVVVEGTTVGVISDFNGEYVLSLKAGTYTLKVSYIGFESIEESVTVENNKTTTFNASLVPSSILGEEIIVTVQARGQLAAVNQQMNSNKIVNVVSQERIRELPDENAAQAISRLPGVHLDGSKVVIRGIESKMNKIMINGVEMPATGTGEDANTRATDLGMISANMLSGIEVYKTLTPDMDADAVGGMVNLRLREAPTGLHSNIMVQGSFNQQEKYLGRSVLWGDISNRFLDDRLGLILSLNYEAYKGGNDWFDANYSERSASAIGEGEYMFNELNVYDELKQDDKIGGALVIDYDLPNGQVIYSGMLSHTTHEATKHREFLGAGSQYHQIHLDRNKYKSLLLNNSLRLEQRLGIVQLDASVSNISIDKKDDFKYIFRFANEGEESFDEDILTDDYRLTMNPEDVYATMREGAREEMRSLDCQLEPVDFNENQWIADFNVKIPIQISDKTDIDFKFGGKYKKKEREYDKDYLEYYNNNVDAVNESIQPWLSSIGVPADGGTLFISDFHDNDYKVNDGYMNGSSHFNMDYVIDAELMDEMWLNQVDLSESTLMNSNGDRVESDYWGWENLLAAYGMAEINRGKNLLIIPGIRFEQVHNEYSAYKTEQGTMTQYTIVETLTKPATHTHLLPHLHLRYHVTDWWDIRFSYNNTLSRPDFNHAIPKIWYHSVNSSSRAGNPYIKPAQSENFDLNSSIHTYKLGLVTVGVFQKTISDMFYMQPTLLKNIPEQDILNEFPRGDNELPSLNNGLTDFYVNSPYDGVLRGLELEWQSNFSWLPSALSGLVLNANYTHVWSETKYMQNQVKRGFLPNPPYVDQVEVDTFYVNRLLQQANDIANFSVGYDYKGFSARLSFRFQGNVISKIEIRPEENEYTNNVYKFDFVVKQKIPIDFASLEVFLNAINFTNVPYSRYSIYPNKGNTNRYTRYTGRQFQLGIRLKY
jgi:TonB-dependent receptor